MTLTRQTGHVMEIIARQTLMVIKQTWIAVRQQEILLSSSVPVLILPHLLKRLRGSGKGEHRPFKITTLQSRRAK